MVELLLLYVLSIRPRTIYGLRQDITDRFGRITKPSLGTIHPALKRLLSKGAVSFEQKYSQGGKKSTYYSITSTGKKVFRELFFENISDNPTIFHNQLSARLITLSMLDKDERIEFLNDLQKKLEIYRLETEKAINNPYVEYDKWQKAVLTETYNSILSLEKLVENFKIY